MDKSKYTRESIKSDIMERVIIRVDYEGMSDMDRFVNILKTSWKQYFDGYQRITKNNFNINVTDSALRNKTIEIPDPERQIIHRFSKSKKGNESTYMDVSDRCAYIDVTAGPNYVGSKYFTDIMSSFINKLLNFDSYIELSRIAIRKIDRIILDIDSNPDTILEIPIFNTYEGDNNISLQKKYEDILLLKDVDAIVNISRDISFVNNKDGMKRQVLLDMDIYKQGSSKIGINRDSTLCAIQSLLEKNLNDPLFFLFVDTFKESYLDKFVSNE